MGTHIDSASNAQIADKEEVEELGDDGRPTGRVFTRKKDGHDHDCVEAACTVNPDDVPIILSKIKPGL